MLRSRLAAGLTLIGSLTIMALCGANCRSRELLREERVKAVALTIERDGYRDALAVKPKEVIKLVPHLVTKTVKEYIKKDKVEPVASGHAKAEATVELPLPPQEEGKPTPESMPVTFGVTADFLITRIRGARDVEWDASIEGDVKLDSMEEAIPLQFAKRAIEIRVSEDIAKALADHEKEGGWFKRHTALACPGASLTYNPLSDHPVDVALTCGYSFVWF